MDDRDGHTQLPCDIAFIAHTGVLSQVCGELLLLGADTVGIFCGLAGAQSCDLGFHLDDEVCQLRLCLLLGSSIYISGVLLTVGP